MTQHRPRAPFVLGALCAALAGGCVANTATTDDDRGETDTGAPDGGAPGEADAMEPAISDRCDGTSVRHISVTGSGSRDGRTEADAGTMADLNAFIAEVGPGGQICIHSGTYGTGHVIENGGSSEAPVTIKGVGEAPVFEASFDPSTRSKSGPVAFEVRASDVVLHNLEFRSLGTCFRFRRDAAVENVTLSSFRAQDLATCVDVERSSTASVSKLTVRNALILRFTRGAIFLASDTSDVTIEDVYIDMQPEQIGGQGSDYPVGIALYDETRDVTIRRATVLNVVGKQDGYTQGDGIDGETSASDVLVEDSYFRGSQDGCIDTKVPNMLIRDTVAVGCKRNFRLWQYAQPGPRAERIASYQPTDAHVFIKGGDTTLRDISVHSDNGSELVAYDCDDPACIVTVEGIAGTLLEPSKLNAEVVSDSTLSYGAAVELPPIPNPTSFTP